MPYNFNSNNKLARDVFTSPKNIDIRDKRLDLPSKLTLLLKRGIGKKYYTEPKQVDAPIRKQHKQYLKDQFMKATYDKYVRTTSLEIDRRKSFEDFTTMQYSPEIASALDIYADESLTKNEYGEIIHVESDNEKIKMVLENLFNDILCVESNLWTWTRNTCQFGNHFLLLDIQPNRGVVGYLPIKVDEIRREEAYDGQISSVKFYWDTNNITFDNWQIAHFRLLSDLQREPYGTSALEAGRLVWKQLQLAEDSMLIYRITRAPERRIFYIDVGNINPEDVAEFIKGIKDEIKRTPSVNMASGNMDFKYNPMAIDEDFFIPRRGEKNTEIETLPGASNLDEIADIEYMQQKLYTSLKVPKAYFSDESDIRAKATLAGQDFRFARTINRMQQAMLATLNQIAVLHLYALGFREKEQLTSFELELTNPSTMSEIEKIDLWDKKGTVFKNLWDESTLSPISYVWGAREILGFTDDQIKVILNQQFLEGKIKLQIETVSQPDLGDMSMDMGGGFGSTEGVPGVADSPFVDQNGNALPATPPEGKKYVATEIRTTMENVKQGLDVMLENYNAAFKKKKKPRNNALATNSFAYANMITTLSELERGLENPIKNINEIKSNED